MAHLINTKSIDVGSMFLMDLSVHESDLNETSTSTSTIIDTELVFPTKNLSSSSNNHHTIDRKNSPTITRNHLNSTPGYSNLNDISKNNRQKQTAQPSSCERIAYHRSTQGNYLGNSLDRLASAINGSPNDEGLLNQNIEFRDNIIDEYDLNNRGEKEVELSQVTIVEPQPPPEFENQFSSSSSLSDESFVASNGSHTSYTASCESIVGNCDDDHGSTTTREDSGVIDIKDLGNQLSNFYDNEHEEDNCQQRFDRDQEKAISKNVMATNLINKSADNNGRDEQNNGALIQQQQKYNNMNNKPTNNHHNNHNRNNSFSQPSRSMSASLPIEVPPRQMKKELKKSKREFRNQTDSDNRIQLQEVNNPATSKIKNKSKVDDVLDDDFLEQEYNENHQNHYPIDEFDEEPLRAEENPMKLFESIQALARSLHEDAELFGSLPPKRMLESPIRSLIFS